jgi:hypothetical protein
MLTKQEYKALESEYDELSKAIDEQKTIINELNNSNWLKFKLDDLFFHKYEAARRLMLQKVSERDDILFQMATGNLDLSIDKDK